MADAHADHLQHTLKSESAVQGIGLFSAAATTAALKPAPVGTGIRFRRTDLPGAPEVPATIDYVIEKPRRTALENDRASVELVEHCLSALRGLGVDNVLIDVDGPELPAGDGSARPYVDAIKRAGIAAQGAGRQPIVIAEPITLREGEAVVTALPPHADECEFLYVLDYGPGSPLQRQVYSFLLGPDEYEAQIAPARTFSTLDEARWMWDRGLFKHLTPKDMLVIGSDGPIENAFRLENEPVRHKVLDMVGDLSLVGRPLKGRFIAVRSGHALNHRLAREIIDRFAAPVASTPRARPALDTRAILGLLPHRYPMVLIDRVLEMEDDRRAIGIKNVTVNEPFFQGHYPASPIMPGVLIVEAMCQLAGLMLNRSLDREGKVALLISLDDVRWRRSVTPGDQLRIEAECIRSTRRLGEVRCRATVEGELAAEAHVKFIMVDPATLK